MKKWYILSGVVIVLVLAIVIVLHLLTVQPASVKNVAVFTTTYERDKLAGELDYKARSLAYSLQTRQGNKTTIDIGEKELNAYIQVAPDMQRKIQSLGAKNPVVKLDNDRITASAFMKIRGQDVPVTATLKLRQGINNSLVYEIDNLKVGLITVPESMMSDIEAKINSQDGKGEIELPPGITNVDIENGKLVLTANPQVAVPR
ncbi:MAG: hypothetical protein ACYC27_20520 [Armatimonadota bacterium]